MRYFIGFMVTILLLILLIFLIFRSNGNKSTPRVTARDLTSYSTTDAVAIFTTDGPINADSIHQQDKIIVGNSKVTFQVIQGYNGNVVSQHDYANNQNAYYQFLSALSKAGFTKGIKTKAGSEDGLCSTGNRYIYELSQNGQDIERYWSTTCGNPSSFQGNPNLTMTLFQAQVPDFGQVSQGLQL